MKAIALVKYNNDDINGRWAVWTNKLGNGVFLDNTSEGVQGILYWKRYILIFFDSITNNKKEMKESLKKQSKYLIQDYIIIEGEEVYEFIEKIEEFLLLKEII